MISTDLYNENDPDVDAQPVIVTNIDDSENEDENDDSDEEE